MSELYICMPSVGKFAIEQNVNKLPKRGGCGCNVYAIRNQNSTIFTFYGAKKINQSFLWKLSSLEL